MSSLSIYAHKQLLDFLFGSGSPATVYFARFTVAPGIDGTGGTECTGGTYARAAATNNTSNFPAATDDGTTVSKTLGNDIAFAESTTDEGTTVAVGIYDALSGGNFLGFATVTSQEVPSGIVFKVLTGTVITLAAA